MARRTMRHPGRGAKPAIPDGIRTGKTDKPYNSRRGDEKMNQHVIDYYEAMQIAAQKACRPMAEWYYFSLWFGEMESK